ncbi:PIN-like domain-containing protein [Leeuwenhoekiella sp. CH_XMU1409-2]|uniref:PIN-like domain-containing protein n=1 Tax=Leeuwenhoekiella sp. CH_XMU1409-2 TaxID=3107768 RepID=UPI0030098B4D
MEDSIFRLTEEHEKELFEKGHIVFDSSALLSFYGYTDRISEEYFNKIFKALKGRLWLPAQVLYEFEKNREKVITKPKGEYLSLIKSVKKDGGYLNTIQSHLALIRKNSNSIQGQIKTLCERTLKDDKHPHIEQKSIGKFKEVLKAFEANLEILNEGYENLLNTTQNQIDEKIKELDEKSKSDNFRERLDKHFTYGASYSYDKMLEIIKEGRFRYENEIPPGYKDEKDKIGFQMYGDLLLWFQIIDYAQNEQKPIIFVTNDVKEDWWQQDGNGQNSNIPRHELLYEFKDKSGQKIWFYTIDRLIYKSNQFLNTEVSEEVIEEIKNVNISSIDQEWLDLLQDALDNDEDVRANHRYKYKGRSLGTWLVGIAQRNKEDKKLEIRAEIEDLGFDYNLRGRTPEASTKRFIRQLTADNEPLKMNYQNWFNQIIAPKKDDLTEETIEQLNQVWELKFEEIRYWEIPSKIKDRVDEWKEFRYNSQLNPRNKWSTNDQQMGDLYTWVLKRKKDPELMELVFDKFSQDELDELRREGFPIKIINT